LEPDRTLAHCPGAAPTAARATARNQETDMAKTVIAKDAWQVIDPASLDSDQFKLYQDAKAQYRAYKAAKTAKGAMSLQDWLRSQADQGRSS